MEAVIDPARQHVASDKTGVLNPYHQAASVGRCYFRLDDGNCHGEEANTETLDCSASDEGTESRSEDLYEGAKEVDQATKTNRPLAADHITKATRNERTQSCRGLQASNRDTRNRGIDRSSTTISTAEVAEEALDKDWIDQQSGHDTYDNQRVLSSRIEAP